MGQGTAVVYAECGNVRLKCKVNVVNSYISNIRAVTLKKGETKTVYADIRNVSGVSVKVNKSRGRIEIKLKGTAAGRADCTVYDVGNPSMKRQFVVTVKGGSAVSDDTGVNYSDTYSDDDLYQEPAVSQSGHPEVIITVPDSSADKVGDDYAEQVLKLVNKERKANGLDPVVLDEGLCAVADLRAKEIGTYFSHTRPNGKDCFSAVDEAGIDYSRVSENIAKGQKSTKQVVESWMNSEMHRANILDGKVTALGVGYDPDTDCWVQVFATLK